MIVLRLVLPLLCLAALPVAALAETRHFTAEYRLYVSGLLIGKSFVHLSLSEADYRLSAHIKPAGAGRLVGNSHVVSTTQGKIKDGDFMPERLDLSWTSDEKIKSSHMDYKNGAPLKFVSGYQQPDEFKSKNPVDIKSIGPGSVDPFLGMLSPLNGKPLKNACSGNRRIFDGRRLAQLSPGESLHLTAREHGFDTPRPAVKCNIIWQPIAGYSERSLDRSAEFPPIETHFFRIADTEFAAPMNMRGRARYGRVTIYAVQYFTESDVPPQAFDIATLSGLTE